jgi:hypothetical protein
LLDYISFGSFVGRPSAQMAANVAIAMNGLASPINATSSYEDMSKEEAEAETAHNMKESEL